MLRFKRNVRIAQLFDQPVDRLNGMARVAIKNFCVEGPTDQNVVLDVIDRRVWSSPALGGAFGRVAQETIF